MTVYVDVLFIVNFMINSLLIYATALIARYDIHILRLCIASVISALYAVVMFFPDISFMYSGLAKIGFSIILIIFTFKIYKITKILKFLFIFYMVSFIFGGAIFGIMFFTNSGKMLGAVLSNGELYLNLNVGVLLGLSVSVYVGILFFTKVFNRNYAKDKILKELIIRVCDEEIRVTALIDTGCELCDPLTQKPAMIVEESMLPKGILNFTEENSVMELSEIKNEIDAEKLRYGIRYLPFSSVGCESGYIKAFVADSIEMTDSEYCISGKKTVGLVKFSLTEDGLYKAIINPDMLEKREEKEEGYVKKIYEFFKNKDLFLKACLKGKTGNKSTLHKRK